MKTNQRKRLKAIIKKIREVKPIPGPVQYVLSEEDIIKIISEFIVDK